MFPLPTHLTFVTIPDEASPSKKADRVTGYALTGDTLQLQQTAPAAESSPFYLPAMCDTDASHASPNGQFLILQYNCEANLFIRILDTHNNLNEIASLQRGYFIDWSPDSTAFLFRNIDDDDIWLLNPQGENLAVPDLPFGSYGGAFAPNGRSIIYVASPGLHLGSEMGTYDLVTGVQTLWRKFDKQVIAYPRFSPDGQNLAYILMEDNNIPFTVGELWQADVQSGKPLTMLAAADAGHGYPPIWSPDSNTLVYVNRDNPDTGWADHDPRLLHSNLYVVTLNGDAPVPLTAFSKSLVYDATWAPSGNKIAFTANNAIWTVTPGQPAQQISPPGQEARHPAWINLPVGN